MGFSNYINNWLRHDSNTRALLREVHRRQEATEQEFLKIRISQIRYFTQTSHEMGVSKDRLCNHEVIVSLTSFGQRIYDVHLAIESIMQGSVRPNRIILWLAEEEFRDRLIPASLKRQQERGLEIAFCKDIRSYKKLIYTLQQNPDAIIVTIDDDVLYEYDTLERMVHTHLTNPTNICACRLHQIVLDANNKPLSYLQWKMGITDIKASPLNFPTGIGGVLYPPHCLPNEVFNEEVFMKLCPTADDVWFYAMAKKNDTHAIKVPTPEANGHFTELPSSKISALSQTNLNISNCPNDTQLRAVFEHYNLYSTLLTAN